MTTTKDLVDAIEKRLKKEGNLFLPSLWTEAVVKAAQKQNRWGKLLAWIDRRLDDLSIVTNVMTPANRDEDYKKRDLDSWLDNMKDIAVLTSCELILLDEKATEAQRENIEYTLEKLFGVRWSEYLNDYV